MATQLDRIEDGVKLTQEMLLPGVRDRPPQVPREDEEDPGSPRSDTTVRLQTPPPISADAIAQQFDDMRNLLGTLIGRTNDLAAGEPRLQRIERLLERALMRIGEDDLPPPAKPPSRRDSDDELPPFLFEESDSYRPSPARTYTGSMYSGSNAMYSDEFGPKIKQPANSFTQSYDKRKRWSAVPSSLLDGDLPASEFDEEFIMNNLPPDTPASEYDIQPVQIPPHIAEKLNQQRMARGQQQQQPYEARVETEYEPSEYTEYEDESPQQEEPITSQSSQDKELPTPPSEGDRTPIGFRQEQIPDDDRGYDSSSSYDGRGPIRNLPPPQPVDVPTPVRSPGQLPPPMMQNYPGMRPPFMPGGMPPMPPGMGEMPRPSLPRIAGVRDPISTT
jgi:hypothetical protein